MLKRTLVILILTLAQAGCSIEEGGGAYELIPMTEDGRQLHERDKREFIKIEDLKVESGPLAAWGRKISADIEVHYTDGTVAYRGPIHDYIGFHGSTFIHNADNEPGALVGQTGIWLGINGMAVGGKRRIEIEPKLVCGDTNSRTSCFLIKNDIHGQGGRGVRNEKLIVEATLTASCIPVLLRIPGPGSGYFIEREIRCRDTDLPKRDPSDPIWRFY
ncbi:exported hypothetical protein [Nitrospira lenta]|uniref:Uncharacterized protein n=2 Tax=Nitrospira lenta TaxID=1436998 RepID=A0A330LGZ2_9BACT|nr:exported hypothetical protein [Nitrospira lenta]